MTRSRPALTFFELLVVLALLLFLLGLLLPLLARTRESAARVQSANNLKQIALACHNYVAVTNAFPPGNDANNFSTAAYVLPYVEQQNLYNQIDFKKPMDDKANAAARKAQVKLFLSPLDPLKPKGDGYGPTNYLFNAGAKPALADNNGVFYQDSKIKFADIADGTSNTLLAGETLRGDGGTKAVTVQRQHVLLKDRDALKDLKDDSGVQDFKDDRHIAGDRCASWMDGRFLQGTFTATRTFNDPKPDVSCAGLGGLSGLRGLEEAVNVALCDGSVRTVRKKVNVDVWKGYATRNGHELPGDF